MAEQSTTIKTRIQLKNDIEANWNKVINFIPKKGEAIVYSAETAQDELPQGRATPYPFSRLKIGDGETTVINLPFIDAGTLNGENEFIIKYNYKSSFPEVGDLNKLYIDLSTNIIYYYNQSGQYIQLSRTAFNLHKTAASLISSWNAGTTTTAAVENNILIIKNGLNSILTYTNHEVIDNVLEG